MLEKKITIARELLEIAGHRPLDQYHVELECQVCFDMIDRLIRAVINLNHETILIE